MHALLQCLFIQDPILSNAYSSMKYIKEGFMFCNTHFFLQHYYIVMRILQSLLALLISSCSIATCSPDQQATETLLQSFRQPKNIAFAVFLGGSSHVEWVLSIMEELSKRGHHTTYLTRVCIHVCSNDALYHSTLTSIHIQDSHVKYGKRFPSIETVSLGNDTKHGIALKAFSIVDRKRTLPDLAVKLLKVFESTFQEGMHCLDRKK